MTIDPSADGWSIRQSNAFMQSIGTLWERTREGRTDLGIVCAPAHDNGFKRMHGALLMTLADQGLAQAALTVRNARSKTQYTLSDQATINLDVSFLKGVEIGGFVRSSCEVTRETGSMSFVRGLLLVGDEAICSAQATFKFLRR